MAKEKYKGATPEMVDEVFTKAVQGAVADAVNPLIEKFNKTHVDQGIAAGYKITVKVTDGLMEFDGTLGTLGSKEWKQLVRALSDAKYKELTATK